MRWNNMLTGALRVLVWLYFTLVLAVWLLLRLGGDRWWLATLMLFGPRWLYLACRWSPLILSGTDLRRRPWAAGGRRDRGRRADHGLLPAVGPGWSRRTAPRSAC